MGFVDNRIVLATDLEAGSCLALSDPVSGPLYDLGPAKAGSYASALAGMWLVVNCTQDLASDSATQRLAIGLSTVSADINAGGDAASAAALGLIGGQSLWQFGNIDSNLTAAQHRGLAPGVGVGQLFAVPLAVFGKALTVNRYLGFWMSVAGTTGDDGGTLNKFSAGNLSAYLTTSIPTNLRHMPDGIA